MSKAPGDQKVRDRIKEEHNRTFLVEAGAGSGKTHCLASRIARGIATGYYEIEHVAAVTFTRKAAAELRGRLQLALERLEKESGSAEERARVEDALKAISRFFAGTIHSFCGHLLRERPVEARIAPGFVEIDDVEDAHRRKEAWRDFVARERGSGSKLVSDLQAAGIKLTDLDDAFTVICEHDEVEFPAGSDVRPDAELAWSAFDRFLAEIDKRMPAARDLASTCKVQEKVYEIRGRMRVARRHKPGDLADLLCEFEGKFNTTKMWWGDLSSRNNAVAKKVDDLLDDFRRETVIPWLRSWRQYVYHLSITALTKARRSYAAQRRRDNVVNYTDLLSAAATLLRTNESVRKELQDKYKWILVDEFQDTDPIQAEVLLLMAADDREVEDPSNVDWSNVKLRPGALFIVGDPKQSIYRFRRADIDIYNAVKALIERSGGEVLSLTTNFRSLPEVCALANQVFPGLFPSVATPQAPKFELLQPFRPSASSKAQSGIAKLTVPYADDSLAVAEEASRIAAYVEAEVASKRRSYGDFLIIARQRANLGSYATALEERSIPVEVSGAGMFTSSKEVATLSLLLSSLADPLDSVSLVGVLRGSLFGISDRELYAYRRAGGRFELTVPVTEVEGEAVRVSSALISLQDLYSVTRKLPSGATLEVILDRTGLLPFAATGPGGAPAGNLLQAVDMVRLVTDKGGSLAEAAEAIREDAPLSTEMESLPLEPGRRDVVRIMNLHRVKGLEAPVVFAADPTNGYGHTPQVRIVREGRQSRGYMTIKWKSKTTYASGIIAQPQDWDLHVQIEASYRNAEVNRLLYVTATRARDLMIVCRVDKEKENKAWHPFENYLSRVKEIETPAVSRRLTFDAPDCSEKARLIDASARDERFGTLKRESWNVGKVTDESHHRGVATRIRAELADEPIVAHVTTQDDAAVLSDTPSHGADTGYEWGLLIHGLLEHAMLNKNATRQDLERLARWLTVESPDLREYIGKAVDVVEQTARADFWKEARQSGECHVEAPFSIKLEGTDGVPSVVRGVIDLVYGSEKNWKVIDYKTDQVKSANELLPLYHAQVAHYVRAWQKVTGSSSIQGSLFSVRTNSEASVEPLDS